MNLNSQSLDDRRPQFLRQMVGNGPIVRRLSNQMKQGTVPSRVFLYGPSGSGKTTVARILARHFFCLRRTGEGDPCGTCDRCRRPLGKVAEFEQWTAARLEQNWGWWECHGRSVLLRSDWAFGLDEAQDLSKLHQKDFYDILESAQSLVIFATTHKNEIIDALVNRFGANVYELKRPKAAEALPSLKKLCIQLNVVASEDAILLVARHYQCDMRKCVDFFYTAAQQASGGVVDDDFLEAVCGDVFKNRPSSEADLLSQPEEDLAAI